tara:strand:- start:775 stop:1386 length:612 start_codon:yes stop_codon:yes gene_type:complete
MNPVDFFGEWAEIGKDIGMEKGHAKSVQFMIDKILENKSNSFTFLDAGCGNGWVVRKMNDIELCSYSAGLDGAKKMIEKAKTFDSDSDYFCSDLLDWIPNKKYDVIHSMEVFYYFVNPEKIIQKIYDTWLNKSGILVFGVDHYKENKSAINWPHECGVFMNTLSIDDWNKIIIDVGFKNITFWQIGKKNDWAGTLVFKAEKQH